MIDERIPLSACVTAATRLTPLITRDCVHAAHSSKPHADRERSLSTAIRNARQLLAELTLQQTRLGWRDSSEDAA